MIRDKRFWLRLFACVVLVGGGIGLLFGIDWRIGLGVFLVVWGNNIDQGERYAKKKGS